MTDRDHFPKRFYYKETELRKSWTKMYMNYCWKTNYNKTRKKKALKKENNSRDSSNWIRDFIFLTLILN